MRKTPWIVPGFAPAPALPMREQPSAKTEAAAMSSAARSEEALMSLASRGRHGGLDGLLFGHRCPGRHEDRHFVGAEGIAQRGQDRTVFFVEPGAAVTQESGGSPVRLGWAP